MPCDDKKLVFNELCIIVDEWIEAHKAEGEPLPPATAGIDFQACVSGQNAA
jgi:hypothetical protein